MESIQTNLPHANTIGTPSKNTQQQPRRPLGSLESNVHGHLPAVSAAPQTPLRSSHTANGQQEWNASKPAMVGPKASPGLLRGFFDLISPELKRMRSTGDLLPSAGDSSGLSVVDDSHRQLECDETLGPIPIFLEQTETDHTHSIPTHDAEQEATIPETGLLALPTRGPVPVKSPMSTLLSVAKPATGSNLPADLPTPRGLSFAFSDMQLPLNNQFAATVANHTGAPLLPPISATRLGQSESRDGTADSPSAQTHSLSSPSPPGFASSAGAASPRFTCAECAKSFPSNSALAMHLLVHSGDKPFACPQKGCAKRFRQKGHLVSHYRKHTGEKPFLCPGAGCSKRFKDKSGLNTHVKRQHPGVSAVHVTATVPVDSDEYNMDPALEAAIADANVTLQALQSSTLAASGQTSRSGSAQAKKRSHAHMDRTPSSSSSTTPRVGLDSPYPDGVGLCTDDDSDAAMTTSEHATTTLPTDDADKNEASPSTLASVAAAVTEHDAQPLKKRRSDVGLAPVAPTTHSAQQLSPSLNPVTRLSFGPSATQQLLAHSNTGAASSATPTAHLGSVTLDPSHRLAIGSGAYSPMAHGAPSPVSFSQQLGLRDSSRSGTNTPTPAGGFVSWMPAVPLPAPVVVAHAFAHLHTQSHGSASGGYHANSLLASSGSVTPSSSSPASALSTTPPHAATLFNPSTTSAFSFKATPTLAAAAAAL